MKVAISLPDPLFDAAEQLAEHLQLSRSQLYAQALSSYLLARRAEAVTEKLNEVYSAQPDALEGALSAAQWRVLDHETW